jgi:aspartyl-tRNA(Asn)/glutamyl-tRNA(Gln) amidotransferase subunit A
MDLFTLTISQASQMLDEKKITSVELTESVLGRIEEVDGKIQSYLKVMSAEALESARQSDERIATGKRLSKLDGVTIALKDLICTKGVETTAASNILKGFIPPYDATIVRKLKEAGAIIIGKSNLDAFAHGSSTENSDFQTTKNPWDLTRIPGGSSGGPAAAIASDQCMGSIGTDTGGSIRLPASLCGVVGLKPTYGRVSRYGVIAMASSLDVVGPITKSTEDAAIIMEIISGKDPLDATTLNDEVPSYSEHINDSVKGMKIGIPEEYFGSGIDKDVEEVVRNAISTLESLGMEAVKISLPHTDYGISTYYILQPAEVSSNLSRYDGIKYGYSTLTNKSDISHENLADVYCESRGEGFGDEAKRRIMLGSYVLSAGYYDAYYKKALKMRTLVKKDFDDAFSSTGGGVDAILTPVSPTPAFKIGEKSDDPVQMYLSDIFTVPINPAGVPAISTPAGFVERDGKKLPVGVQIIGPMLGEETILRISNNLEKTLKINKERPQL